MSNSKPLPSFTFDLLCYLNRDQLERFVIVCRPLKNLIGRYFHSKPYRVFNHLTIKGGMYALRRYYVRWHPNRDDYSVQQFLDGQECSIDKWNTAWDDVTYYSFAEMRPYLAPTVRIKMVWLFVGACTYNPEHIAEMESIVYLWQDGWITITNSRNMTWNDNSQILAEDFQPILNSPTVLQCQHLSIYYPRFSFKNYKVFYTLNVIDIFYMGDHIDVNYWPEFFEQPGVKPVVTLHHLHRESIDGVLDRLSKAFSSAVLPNAFKLMFVCLLNDEPLIEFRETNKTSGDNLELKKVNKFSYSLERYSI